MKIRYLTGLILIFIMSPLLNVYGQISELGFLDDCGGFSIHGNRAYFTQGSSALLLRKFYDFNTRTIYSAVDHQSTISEAHNFYKAGDLLIFDARDSTGKQLWSMNYKTGATPVRLTNYSYPGYVSFFRDDNLYYQVISYGGKVYFQSDTFTSGGGLWQTFDGVMVSDGTVNGSRPYLNFKDHSITSFVYLLTMVNNKLLFYIRRSNDQVFYTFDGVNLRTVATVPANDKTWPISVNNNRAYIYCNETGSGDLNTYIYKFDGNKMDQIATLKNCYSITLCNNEFYYSDQKGNNTTDFFKADTNFKHEQFLHYGSFGGWVKNLITVGDKVFFVGDSANTGNELWISNGTPAGTHMVADINHRGYPGSISIPFGTDQPKDSVLFSACGKVYFIADDDVHGPELWESDGTDSGTILVRDFCPGKCAGITTTITEVDGKLYMLIRDTLYVKADCSSPLTVAAPLPRRPVVDVYPNPAKSHLNIKTYGPALREVKLYDMQGSAVLLSVVSGQVQLSSLPPGMYYLMVQLEDGSVSSHRIQIE